MYSFVKIIINILYPNLLPNKQIISKYYSNKYFAFESFDIAISYNNNLNLVKKIILKTIYKDINTLKDPSPIIRFKEFGKYGAVFEVIGFLSLVNISNQWDIISDLKLNISKKLKKNNILIVPSNKIT